MLLKARVILNNLLIYLCFFIILGEVAQLNAINSSRLYFLTVCVFGSVLQVLFLGPLMQLAIDCPWNFTDGIRVAFGESKAGFSLRPPSHRMMTEKMNQSVNFVIVRVGGGTVMSVGGPAHSLVEIRCWCSQLSLFALSLLCIMVLKLS